ncbi:uncharacterized protein J7T54_003018 [Emericellopsis cladophorae]|uniref:Uncharacterized protein n=1 Tax=Emericellopsis cladophorae TaxID=2686198 RepID=A0A9P9XZN5_9HYPO|nr:uncharacterized protein J7T54_003018 [Emericellopsis cladophorae]KAI6780239.1 hypothetical protein J7T54_003018 [Emericellopsis cladophorae]
MPGGWNPVAGRDPVGSRPPGAPYGAPSAGQPYIPYTAGPGVGYYTAAYPGWAGYSPFYANLAAQSYYPYVQQPNGTANVYVRNPQAEPPAEGAMPAAQMSNVSGGVGCEPGYNYFFPSEHTKVHVFRSGTPPWQLPAGAQIQFKAAHIPVSVTLGELLKGFGCDNPSAKKNRCWEIVAGGNGTWYKGFGFDADNKDMTKKTLKDVGWDKSRTGMPGEKPVVCLWFCRE